MKKFLQVTILSAIYTFIKMIAGFIIGKVVAIYTGPSGVAMLGQVQSLITIVAGTTSAPVSTGLVRYTAEKLARRTRSMRAMVARMLKGYSVFILAYYSRCYYIVEKY